MVKPPLRTKTVGTKLSEPEYAQLEAVARERGLTVSEWCRTVLLNPDTRKCGACQGPVLSSGNGHATKSAGAWCPRFAAFWTLTSDRRGAGGL